MSQSEILSKFPVSEADKAAHARYEASIQDYPPIQDTVTETVTEQGVQYQIKIDTMRGTSRYYFEPATGVYEPIVSDDMKIDQGHRVRPNEYSRVCGALVDVSRDEQTGNVSLHFIIGVAASHNYIIGNMYDEQARNSFTDAERQAPGVAGLPLPLASGKLPARLWLTIGNDAVYYEVTAPTGPLSTTQRQEVEQFLFRTSSALNKAANNIPGFSNMIGKPILTNFHPSTPPVAK